MEQERLKGQGKVPRYEILLEMGRIYNQEREIRQGSYIQNEGEIFDEDIELDDESAQIIQEETEQQKQLKQAIEEIKAGNYVSEDVKYIEEYQTPNNDENNEYDVNFE